PPASHLEGIGDANLRSAGQPQEGLEVRLVLIPAPLTLHACIHRNPVDLPGLAAVLREGLLESVGVRGDVGEHVAHQDQASVERFLVEEFAAAVVELPDSGLPDPAYPAVGEIQAPLVSLWIVQPQRNTLD